MRQPDESLPHRSVSEFPEGTLKACISCHDNKLLGEFHRKKNGKFGRRTECKTCLNLKVSQQRRETGINSKYYQNRLAKYPNLRAEINAKVAEQRAENPYPSRSYSLRYYYKNREAAAASAKVWREANKGYTAEWYRRLKKEQPNRYKALIDFHNSMRRERLRSAGESYTKEQWAELKQRFDNRCVCCGGRDNLQPDHIVCLSRGGGNDISNIQPLCGYCNGSKGARHSTDYRQAPFLGRGNQ